MTLDELNALPHDEALETFARCCGCRSWADSVAAARPFDSWQAVDEKAAEIWQGIGRDGVLEAFTHHPRIGADIDKLREKFASTANWSAGEQSAVAKADETVLERLRDGNIAYEERYGHIFIVCATGKSAAEMLEILESRMDNELDEELEIAKGEQMKITLIRLEKLRNG